MVSVFDLFTYLSVQVPANPQRGEVQHPVIQMRGQNNFPLALRRGGLFKSAAGSPNVLPAIAPMDFAMPPLNVSRLEHVLGSLYPTGPRHDEIWSRAGGEVSTLALTGNGRAAWHAALKTLAQGGGGASISFKSLIAASLSDYHSNRDLLELAQAVN